VRENIVAPLALTDVSESAYILFNIYYGYSEPLYFALWSGCGLIFRVCQ